MRAAAAPLLPLAQPLALALPEPMRAPSPPGLSASAWLFVRGGSAGPALLPGGALGGSQAGARVTYRLNGSTARPLAISARLYSPLESRGAEAALGVDWQPLAALPLHLLAERRESIGHGGRSDWQLTLYGGLDRRPVGGRLHLEAYGQAGVVGIERRDLFADGAMKGTVIAGPAEIGVGAWGGAQPGVARLDIGPHVAAHLRLGRATLRAEADWRFRVAGDAVPGSGPALTLSAGF